MTLRRRTGRGHGARHLGQPRTRATTHWASRSALRDRLHRRGDRRRAGGRRRRGRVPTTSRSTSRTWWSGRCGPRSTRWGSGRPGSGSPATTRSRTPAAWARPPRPSSVASHWPAALVAGGTLLLDDDAAFRLAARLEGHPDNVAPAWYGGFVVCGRDDQGDFWAVPSSVDPRVSAVAFVPPTRVSTEEARRLLPASVPHADAAANAGRAALLVAALAGRARAPAARHPRPAPPGLPAPGDAGERSTWSRRCAPAGSPPWSREPGRRCSRCAPTATSTRWSDRRRRAGGAPPRARPRRRPHRLTTARRVVQATSAVISSACAVHVGVTPAGMCGRDSSSTGSAPS